MQLFAATLCVFGQVQLMDKAPVLKMLPKIADKRIEERIKAAGTFFYTEEEMPRAYQDAVPPITGIRSMSFTDASGAFNASPGLNRVFVQGAQRFQFPWHATAGFHRCQGRSIKFVSLPTSKRDSGFEPVVFWREGLQYHWIFPKGAVVGEILTMPVESQEVVFEVRIRERQLGVWNVDVFRPFPEAKDLAAALNALPKDEKDSHTAEAAKWARDETTTQAASLSDNGLGVFAESGAVDQSPCFKPALIRRLLGRAKYRSAYGKIWKSADSNVCYAPTVGAGPVLRTEEPGVHTVGIVPANYDAGLVSVDETSCARCHKTTGNSIGRYSGDAVLYGGIWGSDQIFSFHPFSRNAVLSNANYGGQDLNPEMYGTRTIEPFNSAVHSEDVYRTLPSDDG